MVPAPEMATVWVTYLVGGVGSCGAMVVVAMLVVVGFPWRRFTIKVHPNKYEAPHFRSSTPHPKTDFSENQNESRWILPWPKYTQNGVFRNKIGIPTILA